MKASKADQKGSERSRLPLSLDSCGYPRNRGFTFEPIGYLETCFKDKFGVPRQPGLADTARGKLKLRNDPDFKIALRGLDGFSHLWLVFVFHLHGGRKWKPSIRPPRLGGAKKVGVLASRSPHRPNPIGLSAVKIERVDLDASGGPEIWIRGVDLLDGTPILDIKPYLPYADSIPLALAGWAEEPIARVPVEYSEKALAEIGLWEPRHPGVKSLITEILELDPRPAFQKRKAPCSDPSSEGTRYGFRLFEFDVKWEIRGSQFYVLDLVEVIDG